MFRILYLLLFLLSGVLIHTAWAQPRNYNPNWFSYDQTWIRVGTVHNAMHEMDASALISRGMPALSVDATTLKMFSNGEEVPIEIVKNTPESTLAAGDKIRFFGRRNSGRDELWAYNYNPQNQSSRFYSLYTDTTYFWVTWSEGAGRRYAEQNTPVTGQFYTGFRDTTHIEEDLTSHYLGYEPQSELSFYSESEGEYWEQINIAGVRTSRISRVAPLNDLVLVDSLIRVRARFAAQSLGNRTARIDLFHNQQGSINFHPIGEFTWSGRGGSIMNGVVSGSVSPARLVDFTEMSFQFTLVNNGTGTAFTNPHFMLFDWFELSYFRGFNLRDNSSQLIFNIRADGTRSVRINNVTGTNPMRVYLPASGKVFLTEYDVPNKTATFFNDQVPFGNERYIAVKDHQFAPVASIVRYQPQSNILATTNEGQYLIITRKMFMAQAEAYATYRRNKSGYTTRIVDAEDIWNVFDYGAERPIALQRFLMYAYDNWQIPPEMVFILADGRYQSRNSRLNANEIPPFGRPSSDAWFTMNYNGGNDWRKMMAIGRLTIRTAQELIAYEQKVRQYERERSEYGLWQKRVTLLSGGYDNVDRNTLFNFVTGFGAQAANSELAADTVKFAKRSNQPLDETSRGDLSKIINDGTFILNFFGHSSPNTWDLLTDNPRDMQNVDKLSLVLSLGCYSGLFATSTTRVISEQFVFAPNAAVAFIGGSGQGYYSALNNYGRNFYDRLFVDRILTLGELERQTTNTMLPTNSVDDVALIQNTILLGDPGVILAYPTMPDYRFDFNPLTINPNPTNLSDSTMTLNVRIRNMGIRPNQDVGLSFYHTKPDNGNQLFQAVVPPVALTGETQFQVKLNEPDAGLHRFRFVIDEAGELTELTRLNNEYEQNYVVFSTGVDLLFPKHNGIHNRRQPYFMMTTPSISMDEQIIAEVSDTASFDRIIAQTTIPVNRLNMIWQPTGLTLQQGKAYWWRARVDKPDEVNWREAAFVYDTLSTGTVFWQQNLKTFHSNTLTPSIRFENEQFAFQPLELRLETSTLNWTTAQSQNNYPAELFANGNLILGSRLRISFYMLVIDGLTGAIRNGIDSEGIPQGTSYNVHSGQYAAPGEPAPGSTGKQQFITALNNNNLIRVGDFVILRVRQHPLVAPTNQLFTSSSDPLLAAFRRVGAFKAGGGVTGTQPPQLAAADGYILFGKRFAPGQEDPSQVSEYIIKTPGVFSADTTLYFNTEEGLMTGPLVGPAKRWNSIQARSNLISATGRVRIEVYGYTSPFSERNLLKVVNPTGLVANVNETLTDINARQYPYIQLVARLSNPDRRAPQLEQWRVNYEPLPEIGLNPLSAVAVRDSVEAGYDYNFRINVQNIGLADADTVVVIYQDVYKPTNGTIEIREVKRDTIRNLEWFNKPITRAPVTTVISNLRMGTLGKIGEHELQVQLSGAYPDQLIYNNFYNKPFWVYPDTIAPKIEVFVDNQFIAPIRQPIFDRENPTLPFIQGRPTFDIYWRDNNPFLRLTDTTMVSIRLFSTNQNNFTEYTTTSPEVSFVPAKETGAKNEAYVQFRPDFSFIQDSVLTIRILSKDGSGNIAEDPVDGYTISFRVTNETNVPSFYPYPNPMSNFTTFAFQLSGKDVSSIERFKMRIYTLSGKPVKTFDLLNEPGLFYDGALRIGWNTFRWDGRDDDGDALANGVYLYKVDLKANGSVIQVNNKNSIEKLVIIR